MEDPQKSLSWQKLNPEKAAEHSRSYYQRQLERDPNFRAKLAERTKARRLRLKMEQSLDITPKAPSRPEKEKQQDSVLLLSQNKVLTKPPKKPCGRPRKYV